MTTPPAEPETIGYDHSRPPAGQLQQVSPLVRRLIAPNGGPFTFTGTCTYVIGHGRVLILDPGPDHGGHVEALLQAVARETVSHIVVTHTHRDHSPAARAVQTATGAQIIGCAPHFSARALAIGETAVLDAANDLAYQPDRVMAEGDSVAGNGFSLTALTTPGHTMNHLCFALDAENALFSGDHVMAWSTSVVAPPDGSMAAYMASLDKLRGRDEEIYWPGHGGPVREPARFVRGLATHRRQRETAILGRLAAGDRTIPDIVTAIYEGLDPRLKPAAGLSVFAHLEDLCGRGRADTIGAPVLAGHYWLKSR